MTKPPDVDADILRLHYAEHWKVGTIATQLGIHTDVVRRVLGLDERHDPARMHASLITPYADFVRETLTQYPRLRATRLYDMLRDRGYRGRSVRHLRDYVALVRPAPKSEVFLRTEPLVGEQSQVDWAHVGEMKVQGGTRALWAFVMVLSWSRAMWAELVYDLSAHSLWRSLVRASAFFGGCTRQWLFDNPKIVVLERHGDAVRFHPKLLELAGHMRIQPRLCAVAKGNQKGRVERSIRYLRDRFFAARTIVSIEQGNRQLLSFIDDLAHRRPHPRFDKRTVGDMFAEERERLLALPNPLPSMELVQPVSADKTAFVRFDRNSYSVPPAQAYKTLTLVADDQVVRVIDVDMEVARHPRCWGRKQIIEAPEHRQAIVEMKRAARDMKGRDRLRTVCPAIDALYARWVEAGRNIGSMTARTVKLLDLYGDAVFTPAVEEMLCRGTHDPGALSVLCDQRRRAQGAPPPLAVELGSHVPDCDVIPHDLGGYDHVK